MPSIKLFYQRIEGETMKKQKALIEHKKRLAFEKRWATYKYNVMERHYNDYKSLSRDIGGGEFSAKYLSERLAEYLERPVESKAVINTFNHVWGYFKKLASQDERDHAFSLMDQYQEDQVSSIKVKTYFLELAKKYQVTYLLDSHYFDDIFISEYSEYGKLIVNWYEKHQRPLMFRESKDPYKVWLSEIMCQQTQVATMMPYYEYFIKTWPSVKDLAKASEEQVLKAWEGLGYYGRARRLLACAKMIVNQYDGHFPKAYAKLVKCPGIGPYTAGAILSICFNQKVPAVDGNVMRVISRVFASRLDLAEPATKTMIEKQVKVLIPDNASFFNQGLMELGATVCSPTSPSCQVCPLAEHCVAKGLGIQDQLPIKSKAKKKPVESIAAILVEHSGKYLFSKTDGEGLLSGLWALPATIGNETDLSWFLENEYGLECDIKASVISRHKHVFTHKIWDMSLYLAKANKKVDIEYPSIVWVDAKGIDDLAISTAFRRLLEGVEL